MRPISRDQREIRAGRTFALPNLPSGVRAVHIPCVERTRMNTHVRTARRSHRSLNAIRCARLACWMFTGRLVPALDLLALHAVGLDVLLTRTPSRASSPMKNTVTNTGSGLCFWSALMDSHLIIPEKHGRVVQARPNPRRVDRGRVLYRLLPCTGWLRITMPLLGPRSLRRPTVRRCARVDDGATELRLRPASVTRSGASTAGYHADRRK